ncbi:B2 protein-like [Euwallacea similis]|uniref:B2 protein-like n=1 Tax=Euwallacea similis TaxID=1736056 RepID=UPI00344BF1A6
MFFFLFISISALANTLAAPFGDEEIQVKHLACMQESGATEEMMRKAFQGEFPDASEFKKHLVCMGKKGGVIDSDGNYDRVVLKEKLLRLVRDEELVDELLEKCLVDQATPEETAFEMVKCSYRKVQGE